MAASKKKKKTNPRFAGEFDRALGEVIRDFRHERDISQAALGDAVDVSFQQIQKYERGTNRVTVARLREIAAGMNLHSIAPLVIAAEAKLVEGKAKGARK